MGLFFNIFVWRAPFDYAFLNTDTKNPSVPVRRGVISRPSGDGSVALTKIVGLVPQHRGGLGRRHHGELGMGGRRKPRDLLVCSPAAATEQVM